MDKGIAIHRIHWLDATYSAGWHFQSELPKAPTMVQSVGWLVAETREAVTLALSVSPDAIGHVSVIPQSGIIARWCLSDDDIGAKGDIIQETEDLSSTPTKCDCANGETLAGEP